MRWPPHDRLAGPPACLGRSGGQPYGERSGNTARSEGEHGHVCVRRREHAGPPGGRGTRPRDRDQLRHQLDKLIAARNPARVIVDFSRLRFCDASGLSRLVAADREARRRHGGLRLVCPEGKVRRLLRFTRLARFIPAFDSLSPAIPDGESGPYATSPRQTVE
ncbi:STAS domain-containing protein [Streptomyces sp. NPDC021212]|uniref:STAS domain-containing protein n=1 Tax=Streptomyces sp. NPDC021212 TaxID=3365118 RepID=UPI0037A6E957